MPSEKQIEVAAKAIYANAKNTDARDIARIALTAAEQAEPAPAARSGAVKVKALEWESIDGGNAFRAPALIFGWIRIETYTLHSWQVQWSVPGICNLLMPNVFDSPSAAKAAAQADYERRILAALEPAEPATDVEPWPKPKITNPDIPNPTGNSYFDCLIHRILDAQQDINLAANESMSQSLCDASELMDETGTFIRRIALYTHPPESRLREAAREAVNCITHHAEDNENTRWVLSLLNAALAQGADDE